VRSLPMNTDTVISQLKKQEPALESVNTALLRSPNPQEVTLDIERAGKAEMDEMWSFVRHKTNPRWLWHAIDHQTGKVLAYVFGRCQDEIFLKLEAFAGAFRSDARLPR
jgi:insertion element IS1 protein InsB